MFMKFINVFRSFKVHTRQVDNSGNYLKYTSAHKKAWQRIFESHFNKCLVKQRVKLQKNKKIS